MKRAFTLIELLVVIAIIAILASILFPVFAQAKLAAKKTQSLNNVRQIGIASQIYMGDYDDTTPPLYWYNPLDTSRPTSFGFHYYPLLIEPYAKNRGIFLCPMDRGDDPSLQDSQGRGRFDPNSQYRDYVYGANTSYGYNYRYLNLQTLAGYSGPRPLSAFSGISSTAIATPAETIMFAEATMKDKTAPGLSGGPATTVRNDIGYSRIEPPFPAALPAPFFSGGGWTGTYPNAQSQGQLWGRFDPKSVLVAWLDGHVKARSIASLKAEGSAESSVNRYWNGLGL